MGSNASKFINDIIEISFFLQFRNNIKMKRNKCLVRNKSLKTLMTECPKSILIKIV